MPAGQLNHVMDVEENRPVPDMAGQPLEMWERVRQALFSITPLGGGEAPRGVQIEATTTHVLRCRYFTGAKAGLRLRCGERVFHVERVVDAEERRRWLDWTVREVNR